MHHIIGKRWGFVGMGRASEDALGIGMEMGDKCFGIGRWGWDGGTGIGLTLPLSQKCKTTLSPLNCF